MYTIQKMRLLYGLGAIALVVTMIYTAFHYGKLHAITDSYIYRENGYYVICLDGEEWLHLERE